MSAIFVSQRPVVAAALLTALLSCATEDHRPAAGGELGPVVESVGESAPTSLQPGDVLLAWERAGAAGVEGETSSGRLHGVADFRRLAIEEVPRGGVTVHLLRDGRELSIPFSHRLGEVEIRPPLPPQLLGVYEEARRRTEAGDLDAARKDLPALAARAEDGELSVWLLLRAGQWLHERGREEDALELLSRAEEASRATPVDALLGRALDLKGATLAAAGRLEEAAEAYREGVERRGHRGAGSLERAEGFSNLGLVLCQLGQTAEGLELLRDALELRREAAPGSLEEAASLNNLGNYEPDLDRQEEYHLAALDIRRRRVPESLEVAASLNNLGNLAWQQGDYRTAEVRLEEALHVFERLDPAGRYVGGALGNLALVAADRGDLATAEARIRRSLDIFRTIEPDGLFYQRGLDILGNVLRRRGDLEGAERYYREALERGERIAPSSYDVANTLLNLGTVESERGNLSAAADLYRRSLELHQRIDPASAAAAIVHNNLGSVLRSGGRLDEARDAFEAAHDIWQRAAPGSLRSASALLNLGNLDLELGRLDDAERRLRAGLAILERLAPESTWVALAARDFGRLEHRRGRIEEALAWYRRAIATLETQQGRLGGDIASRGRFRSGYLDIYDETVDLLLEMGRNVEAFEVHEHSRAQGMLAMLAERRLVLDSDLPVELRRERSRLRSDYDRLQERLAALSPQTDPAEVESALDDLREIRLRQREADSEARRLSPRLRFVRYPEPLDLPSLHRELSPGTVVLSYSVRSDESLLFVIDAAGELRAHRLEVNEEELRDLVRRFVDLLSAGRTAPAALDPLHDLGRELYRLLVAPSSDALRGADRLLVVPDGPLHTLPFAALPTGEHGGAQGARYLLELAPIYFAPSVTTAVELARRTAQDATEVESDAAATRLVAFADPALSGAESSAVAGRLAGRNLEGSGSLPASRQEVEAIARLFGGRAEVYVGSRASEERVKSIGRPAGGRSADLGLLHFATHGFVDRRLPLDSGLVLSSTGDENGLLQAWEIFEELRFDAELVTLSACETAEGAELAGEGLLGLTRAFHYAGARAVLASLWSVPDLSTSALMTRLYRHLLAGESKAEALRSAQLELLAGPVRLPSDAGLLALLRRTFDRRSTGTTDATHPYHWAAFQLYGAP